MRSVLLIGLGRFGRHIAKHLYELGHQVMAIDSNEERLDAVLPYITTAQIGDSTNRSFLASLGVRNFDVCFVAIGSDFQISLETTSLLKEPGAQMVVSRATRDIQEKFLLRNGAKWTAIRYTSEHIMDYLELDDDHAMFEIDVPSHWIGRSIAQIDIRKSPMSISLAQREKVNLKPLFPQTWCLKKI